MMTYVTEMRKLLMAVVLVATATVCSPPASAAALSEAPAAAGIIDSQAFVTFAGDGYSVLVPRGWARTQQGSAVTFRSDADSELIETAPAGTSTDLTARFHPVGVIHLQTRNVTLGTEPASLISFRSLSEPDPVTGKRLEIENLLYSSSHNGVKAMLLFSARTAADNADRWTKIAQSFRWT
ncbi:MAG: hypothetical protein QOF71_1367 [Candidatus Eremiobacteraeota bacterium]|jgi:hypothetical protein|nr:hypothetical protein [Candidatus Eremiobacteraeota bacterium]